MSAKNDYFDWHYKISTFFLLIPPKNRMLGVLYWIAAVSHLFLICISGFLEGSKLFLGGNGSFSADVLNLGMTVLHLMGANRVAIWLFIKKDVDAVLERVRRINLNYSQFDSHVHLLGNRHVDVIPRSNVIEEFRARKMHQTKLFCLKMYVGFVSYVAMNLIVSYTLNYQNPTYEKWNPGLNKTSVYRDYPYPLWYPFDTSISDGYYWLGFLYQPYAFFFLMGGFFCVDSLCLNTIIHLTSHLKILGYAFTFIDKNCDTVWHYSEAMELKEKRLVKCIKELQEIYKCARMLNDIFSTQNLIQGLSMAIIICCAVYRVTSVTMGPEVGYLSSMVMVCALETFIISWFNQNFTLEVYELLHRIYELDWINYPPKLRKMLVFLMKRLQKPCYFTLGSWKPIEIGLFLTTLKASYSFYTLITQSGSKLTTTYSSGKTI